MKKYCFGVDVGGTNIKTGLFDEKGQLLLVKSIPTRTEEKGKYIVDDMVACMKEMMTLQGISEEDVAGVGAGLPGPILSDGTVNGCTNLGWGKISISPLISEKFYGKKVCLLNDANAAALGEMWKGGGVTEDGFCDEVAFVTLGTGVGGGIISKGELITGADGGAGEIGHFPVNINETDYCNCGKRGCLEQYCSATGVVRLAKKKIAGIDESITAKDIFDRAKSGDKEYLEVVEEFGKYLGMGCANIAMVTNPKRFIIGGGVSKAGEIITEVAKKYFDMYVFKPCGDVEFVIATLGNDAGMYGCAYAVMNDN